MPYMCMNVQAMSCVYKTMHCAASNVENAHLPPGIGIGRYICTVLGNTYWSQCVVYRKQNENN